MNKKKRLSENFLLDGKKEKKKYRHQKKKNCSKPEWCGLLKSKQ